MRVTNINWHFYGVQRAGQRGQRIVEPVEIIPMRRWWCEPPFVWNWTHRRWERRGA